MAELAAVVDGVIFRRQSRGGITRLYREVLPRMCDMDQNLHIDFLVRGRAQVAPPQHERIAVRMVPPIERYLRPYRLWAPLHPALARYTHRIRAGGANQIWHSTYYTRVSGWKGWTVVTVVDMIHERFPQLFDSPGSDRFRERKRACIQSADAVICISETTRQDLLRFYGKRVPATFVIPLAPSELFEMVDPSGEAVVNEARGPFLLYVGRRSRHKNFEQLARAYAAWPDNRSVSLVVVGGPWTEDEQRFLIEYKLSDRLQLLTEVDDLLLCRLYNQAAAFVYPSLYEGFGIPLLEAMACGCPIIASHIPSTEEVAGSCAIMFDTADDASLVAAFDLVMAEGRRSDRTDMGLERVGQYRWDSTAARTLAVYRSLVEAA